MTLVASTATVGPMSANTLVLRELGRVRRLVATGAAQAIREAAGATVAEVARAADVDRVSVHRWESGRRVPHGDAAIRYLRVLDELSGR